MIAAPGAPPALAARLAWLRACAFALDGWEASLIAAMQNTAPSPRQAALLDEVARRLENADTRGWR